MSNTPDPKPKRRVIELPGDPPLKLLVNPVDECPNCQRTMTFNKARKCYICVPCNTRK